jgi:hypothetical protein
MSVVVVATIVPLPEHRDEVIAALGPKLAGKIAGPRSGHCPSQRLLLPSGAIPVQDQRSAAGGADCPGVIGGRGGQAGKPSS